MKSSEIFTLIVRAFGLLVSLIAILVWFWVTYSWLTIGLSWEGFLKSLVAALPVLVGIWMLRGAPALVAFAYPPERRRYSISLRKLEQWMTSGKKP